MKRIILTAILALAALAASAQTLVVYFSKPGETYTPCVLSPKSSFD